MKKYLIDTQILIWWVEGSKKLTIENKNILENSIVYVSAASFWEILIKMQSGKLRFKKDINYIVRQLEFHFLDIKLNHVLKVRTLPTIHKDPFDRILIAQSIVEGCELITSDEKIMKYFRK